VFQNYALFPHMSVYENVAFPLNSRRWKAPAIKSAVKKALELVQMEAMGDRLPRELSGGQQQRVAFARAVVYGPDILLMDEPLGALDRRLRADMQVEIKRFHRELGTTLVYVTHDQDEALSMSDRIAVLNRGELEQFATPRELYTNPATRFVAGFVGETNFIDGVIDHSARTVRLTALDVELPLGTRVPPTGRDVTVAIRPESLRVAETSDRAPNRVVVEDVMFFGDVVKCIVTIGGLRLTAKLPANAPVNAALGSALALSVDANGYSLFARENG